MAAVEIEIDGNFVQLLRIKSYCGGMKDDSTLIVSNYEDTFGFGDDLKALGL